MVFNNIVNIVYLAFIFFCISFSTYASGGIQQVIAKPNIIFILLDDVGWKDFGCYGSAFYETPYIDALAREGVRFTHSYAYPQCSPSRFAFMTGQNPAR